MLMDASTHCCFQQMIPGRNQGAQWELALQKLGSCGSFTQHTVRARPLEARLVKDALIGGRSALFLSCTESAQQDLVTEPHGFKDLGSSETSRGPERPEVKPAGGRAGRAGGVSTLFPLCFLVGLGKSRPQMDTGKDEGSLPQSSGPPTKKKFVIPLEEDEIPPAGVKPLFRSSRNPSTTASSAQVAPQTYAQYAIAQPPGGAGATGHTGSEPVKGENPSQTLKTGAKSNSILVSPRQRGNPVLKFVRNVPWEFSEVTPDYVLGQSTCALFLSLRYHNLHPDYIHERLQSLGKTFALRVLLVQVDVKDPQQALKQLAKMCILADCTLVLAWSAEEAGRYLETYKAYEQKPADLLMEKLEQNFLSRATECLTTVKSVNKTDSQTLLATFGSLEQLFTASREDLALCPGLGPQKARRLFDVLHEPFLRAPR